jgi:putative DNA primase/helicase
MNLHQIARALGGEVCSGQVLAPGPGHSRRDRSLAVRLSWQAPDGFIVFSHAGDDWRDCADYVRGRLGLGRNPVERVVRQAPPIQHDPDTRTRDMARGLFFEATDPRGTLCEHYLAIERGLSGILDDALALTLRFHPACPFRDDGKLARSPALICALRDARVIMGACGRLGDLDEVERQVLRDPELIVAVQRIRLTSDGRKLERRSLGPMENAVVFCSSIFESFYAGSATIAEGVETALAMRKLGFQGCVALAGAGRFRSFEPPFHWGQITISGENDAGASQSAWRGAGPRWAAADHGIEVWTPPDGFKDANDLLRDKRQ